MLRNMKVGTKLIAVLVAPLVVLAALAAIGINQRRADAADARRVEELTELTARSTAAIQELENEQILALAFLGSEGTQRSAEFTDQKGLTDEKLGVLRESLDDLDTSGEDELDKVVDSALQRIDNLDTIRSSVTGNSLPLNAAVDQYSQTIEAFLGVNLQAALAAETPELSNALQNIYVFSSGKALLAEQNAILSAVIERPSQRFFTYEANASDCAADTECQSYNDFVTAGSDGDELIERWSNEATAEQKTLFRNETATQATRTADDIIVGAVDGGGSALVDVDPNEWLTAALDKLKGLYTVETTAENSLIVGVLDQAQELRTSADQEVRLFILVTVIAIAVSLMLALLVARAVARPLQQLTEAANTLSTERLPRLVEQLRNPAATGEGGLGEELTPININSKDEIGQLADAFNSIQQVTVEVAEEQAQLLRKGIGDIFINLARRNQTLLDRQIEFIDQLEANEEDPDQLDNLFKLDHLATRMRRNAESLLVLAGAEPPRRRGRPVALADVVRVAIGEVEDFARISLLALDDAMVGGNVAVDLAHLLSELMENATHFSPPDTHVEVVGHAAPDGGYTLTVTDQGIGMSSEQLSEANHQLANPPLVGLALSRSLGFIVIGRLAQRFEIEAELTSSPSGGVSALVRLPRELVTGEDGSPLPIDEAFAAELAPPDAAIAELAEPMVDETALASRMPDDRGFAEPATVGLDDALADDEEVEYVEVIEEIIVEEEVDDEPLGPESFEEAVPEGDDFERGLESLISGQTPPGPIEADEPGAAPSEPGRGDEPEAEPELEREPEPEPAPVVAAAEPIVERGPATPPSTTTDLTAAGLVKRTPKKQKADVVGTGPLRAANTQQRPSSTSRRSPEEVRKMLSRYRGGLKKGRVDDESPGGDSEN